MWYSFDSFIDLFSGIVVKTAYPARKKVKGAEGSVFSIVYFDFPLYFFTFSDYT